MNALEKFGITVKKNSDSAIVTNLVYLMKEFGYTPEQVANMDLSSIIIIMQECEKMAKEQEKAMDKVKK